MVLVKLRYRNEEIITDRTNCALLISYKDKKLPNPIIVAFKIILWLVRTYFYLFILNIKRFLVNNTQ